MFSWRSGASTVCLARTELRMALPLFRHHFANAQAREAARSGRRARALELTEAAPGAVGGRRAKGRIQAFGAKWAWACPNYVRKWFGSGRIYSAPVALTSRGQPRGLPTDFASWGPDSAPHRFHAPGSVAQGWNGASRSVHSCSDVRISLP